MKTFVAVLLAVTLGHVVQGQTLTVHKTDQTIVSIPLSEIDSITFTAQSVSCPPTVSWGEKTYSVVQIGTQCWFRENLDIGTIVPGLQEQANNGTIEKYCWNDDPVACAGLGGLYQWDEAMQYDTTEGSQGICPPGWHIPTLGDFQTLRAAVGHDGNALKREDQGSGAGHGTNSSGFSALLAGFRNRLGEFSNGGVRGHFWSSTQRLDPGAYSLSLGNNDAYVDLGDDYKREGFSIRCLED